MAASEDKRQDFLWIVQSFMLRAGNVVGWHGIVGDAVAASYCIPNAMTARDAALEFWAFFNPAFGGDEKRKCPMWMSNLKDPTYR